MERSKRNNPRRLTGVLGDTPFGPLPRRDKEHRKDRGGTRTLLVGRDQEGVSSLSRKGNVGDLTRGLCVVVVGLSRGRTPDPGSRRTRVSVVVVIVFTLSSLFLVLESFV